MLCNDDTTINSSHLADFLAINVAKNIGILAAEVYFPQTFISQKELGSAYSFIKKF